MSAVAAVRNRFGRMRILRARSQPPRGKPPLRGLRTRAVPTGVTTQSDPGLMKLFAEEYPFLLIGKSYY